jgi:hypothetical protein
MSNCVGLLMSGCAQCIMRAHRWRRKHNVLESAEGEGDSIVRSENEN